MQAQCQYAYAAVTSETASTTLHRPFHCASMDRTADEAHNDDSHCTEAPKKRQDRPGKTHGVSVGMQPTHTDVRIQMEQ